jgi:PAS domain S-box-containing protein
LDMLCIASGDGRFQRLNPAWRILGFTNEELCAAPNIDFVHPEDRAATEAMGRKLAAGETAVGFENRYRCKDGSYRVLMWKAAASPDGSSIFAAARDITDWKAADAAIKAAEERLRLLLESVRDYAIIMLSPTGAVTTWNPGAERIKGYAAGEIVGQHFSRFYPPEEIEGGKPERELAIASERGRYEEEGWRVRKDGSKFLANTVLTAVRDEAGTLRGFAKVTRDITDRKRAEDEIRSLNAALQRHTAQLESANKELEAFCYSVSHDLRAPLRGIDGFSQALLEDYGSKLDEEGRDSLHRVRNGTQRMGQLIDDLLNLSRVTRAEIRREPVDLSAIARGVAEELKAADPRRQVTFDIAEGITAVADPNLLRVVLTNLIGNAWKFTGQQAEARVEFGCSGSNGDRVYFVRDNGVGFDMAYANKLFGAFQRLHAQGDFPGTGVGLATVQRIIHRHGGQVRATAELGLGAAFSFTL